MLLPIKRKLRGWAIRTAPMWVRYLYPTPKLDVRGVVFSEQELLLVRDSADGRWSLPGGWIDLRESVGEAAAREVLEESGHAVTPVKLIAVSNIRRRQDGRPMRVNVFRMFVLCTPDGHEGREHQRRRDERGCILRRKRVAGALDGTRNARRTRPRLPPPARP